MSSSFSFEDNQIKDGFLSARIPDYYKRAPEDVVFVYKNYNGEMSIRLARPKRVMFSSNKYHPESQWLLEAYDYTKVAFRTFAIKDITHWEPTPPQG